MMVDVDKIRSAEESVAEMQDALADLQSGLQRAEEIAVAAEAAKARAEQALKVTLGLIGLSLLLLLLSRKKRA
ncbi:MAG: hypothetical protein ACR2N9_09500 [Acidimicrobiia bacterium]